LAPDLWRRFTIALHRGLAHQLGVPAHALAEVVTVQYAKVAEFQRRGAVHFHALIRVDGPCTPTGISDPTTLVTAELLARLVTEAASTVQLQVPAVDDADVARRLVFGRQLDVRVVRSHQPDDDQALTAAQVADYLAKYSTKSASDDVATSSAHHRRLQATIADLEVRARVATLGDDSGPYRLLGQWGRMLGFRGHFATKSRRYSVTLGQRRRARQRAQARIAASRATGTPLDLASLEADLLADEEETHLGRRPLGLPRLRLSRRGRDRPRHRRRTSTRIRAGEGIAAQDYDSVTTWKVERMAQIADRSGRSRT
jgi:hypothetical protein